MASGNSGYAGKRPKNYYVDFTKRDNRFRGNRSGGGPSNSRYKSVPDISFGHRGFLITSIDEVKSYLEMRRILEDNFMLLYGESENKSSKRNEDDTTNVDDELESELKRLRENRPFAQVKTHCKNSLFIKIKPEFSHVDPIKLVDKFFEDLGERRELMTKFTFKVLPVLDTFRNSPSCAKESVTLTVENLYKETGNKKYFIEFQSRGNYKLDPDDKQRMIVGVAEAIADIRPNWTVSRENADYIVILISLKDVCCLSIVESYFSRCKYNVIEYCKDFAPPQHLDEKGDDIARTTATMDADAADPSDDIDPAKSNDTMRSDDERSSPN